MIFIPKTGKTIPCQEGECLQEVLRRQGEAVLSPCGGLGVCGKCRVRIREKGESEWKEALACETFVYGSLEVDISKEAAVGAICQPEFEGGKSRRESSGWKVAVDLGTTTIEAVLYEPEGTAKKFREASRIICWNTQCQYGADVLTRISYAARHPNEGKHVLQRAVLSDLNGMIQKLCRRASTEPEAVDEIVIAANCTMTHMLLGADVSGIGRSPYRPAFTDAQICPARELGLSVSEDGMIYCFPQASSYIGGDILAGLAIIPNLGEQCTLFTDIGTNGEIILAAHGRLYGCSCAAGPALEGMNISAGMHASNGAIEDVQITDGRVRMKVIGGTQPAGLCGSGVLAAVRELLDIGLIKRNGAFIHPSGLAEDDRRRKILQMDGKKRKAFLWDKPEIYITQGDVRQIQMAKGAIRSGIEILLSYAGIHPKEIERVIIAGQFGRHLPERSLLRLGLLPGELAGKITYAGNTSCAGAGKAVLDPGVREKAKILAKEIEYLELSRVEGYDRVFAESSLFDAQ